MKAPRLLIVSLLLFLFSCRSNSAFEYSETIVRMETELSADIAEADQQVNKFILANKKDSAIIIARHMEKLAEEKLKAISELHAPEVEEGDTFKKEAIRYFSFIRTIYSSFNRFLMAETDRERELERKKLSRIIAEKKQITGAMQDAQLRFAAANDFRIDKARGAH